MTRVFGVMGYPVSHSLSPVMHNAAFRALGLEAIYAPFEVPPPQLGSILRGLVACGIGGLNVTIPLKERVLRYLRPADIDAPARAIRAVNTLVRADGRLRGFNTDLAGIRRVLAEELRVDCRNKRVVLLGAGGAARAVAWVVGQSRPSALSVANRTPAHARRLRSLLRRWARGTSLALIPFERKAIGRALQEADLLVNATSLGLCPRDPLPVEPSALHRRVVVLDLVYPAYHDARGAGRRSQTTALVRAARRRGALAVDGLPMLVYQGAESFRLWWHRPAPVAVMRQAVEEALRA